MRTYGSHSVLSSTGSGGRSVPDVVGTGAGLRRAVAVSSVGKLAEFATLAALATVVPRSLGPTDYGRFALVLTLVTIGTLALTLGGPALVTRYVPAAAPERRAALARALVAHLARGRVRALAIAALVTAVLVVVLPARIPALESWSVLAGVVLGVASTLLLLIGLGLGLAGAWALQYPLQNTALVLGAVGLYRLWGVDGAVLAVPLSAVPAVVLGLVVARGALRNAGPPMALPDGARRFGALQALAAVLLQLVQRGGIVAVALLGTGPAATGFAALAVGMAIGATAAVLQTFTVAVPHLHGPTGPVARSVVDAEAALRRLAWGLLPALVAGGVVGAALLDALVPVVFGEEYRDAAEVFVPAVAVVVLAPLGSLAVQASVLRLRPDVAVQAAAAGVVALVATALGAVPAWGATGGTAATLAGLAVAGVLTMARLPGAISVRFAAASYGAAALVLLVGVAA